MVAWFFPMFKQTTNNNHQLANIVLSCISLSKVRIFSQLLLKWTNKLWKEQVHPNSSIYERDTIGQTQRPNGTSVLFYPTLHSQWHSETRWTIPPFPIIKCLVNVWIPIASSHLPQANNLPPWHLRLLSRKGKKIIPNWRTCRPVIIHAKKLSHKMCYSTVLKDNLYWFRFSEQLLYISSQQRWRFWRNSLQYLRIVKGQTANLKSQ